MSYFSRRRKIVSRGKSVPERSLKEQLFFGFLKLGAVFLVCLCVWYVTRLETFTIAKVDAQGGETISHDEIEALARNELNGAYFLLVPKRFTYFYPEERIRTVLEGNPRIYNVEINRASLTSLEISFDEYVPHALWCLFDIPEVPCYLITHEGYAFAPAPSLSGGAFVRHSIAGISEIHEGIVIEEAQLAAIDTFIDHVEQELSLRITSVLHTENGDIEFAINGGGTILVNGTKDFEETFENLKVVLTSSDFAHIAPGNFQYIDVRFSNKVFVNEELEEMPLGTTTEPVELLPE